MNFKNELIYLRASNFPDNLISFKLICNSFNSLCTFNHFGCSGVKIKAG